MAPSVTIHGELWLSPLMLRDVPDGQPAAVQRWLQDVGVLSVQAEHCRWRLAPESGGYVLTYDVTLLPLGEEPRA